MEKTHKTNVYSIIGNFSILVSLFKMSILFKRILCLNMLSNANNTNITHTSTLFLSQFFFSLGCPKLFWGDDCVKKCPDKCNGCNNINGLCEYGCVPGWNGHLCNEGIIEVFCLRYLF